MSALHQSLIQGTKLCSSAELIVNESHQRVKDCPVVIAFLTELDEIFTRLGHHVAVQFKIQRSQIGDHPHVACAYGIHKREFRNSAHLCVKERNVKVYLSS